MTFHFSHEELSFLAKRFGYKHLEGIEFVRHNKEICSSALVEKGYMVPYKRSYELSNEVRLLLSTWVNVKYTLVREGYLSNNDVFAILANEERILSYSFHDGKIEIVMCDFSVEVMDQIITDYLDIVECNNCCTGFNITFTDDEYLSYFDSDTPSELICKKTGLSPDDVSLIKQSLANEKGTSFIVQDVVEDIGCMGILTKCSDGYVLVKHIVPNNDISNQKIVISKGNSQDIVDSIYIL
ncbi:MAG: hypothetical protein IJZ03_01160 [Clostridia bacterium]|nr:hypothetical protein [Clostridia bacterium]